MIDYGEVLCHAADPAGLTEMARVAGADPGRFAAAYWQHREPYDRGALDGPAYWRLVGETVGFAVDSRLTALLVEGDIGIWTRLDDEMLAWADGVAGAGVRVGLLSNMVREIGIHLRDTLGLFQRFASVTYSYELLLAKPDREIYEHALESLGVLARDTLFVDDRLPNVEAARALGMHAHHFRGQAGLLEEIDARYALVPDPRAA